MYVVSGTRTPNLDAIGISRFGIEQTSEGYIKVDGNMQSSIPSIYAIGDVTEGPMVAVKAIKQGKAAVAAIAGEQIEVDLTFMPVVAHTIPPVVSVGLTEQTGTRCWAGDSCESICSWWQWLCNYHG